MDFNQNKKTLSRELEQFSGILNELLPRYTELINKSKINTIELKELGEIEHFLLDVTAKITEIKDMLDQNLFGHSLDLYYKYKEKALLGDVSAQLKLERLRNFFNESLKRETFVNWN